jgi:hypothetical protein
VVEARVADLPPVAVVAAEHFRRVIVAIWRVVGN